jgi:hypothetical protein
MSPTHAESDVLSLSATRRALRGTRFVMDGLGIAVVAIGSVLQGTPQLQCQLDLALSLWAPTFRRLEARRTDMDTLMMLEPFISQVLDHTFQRAQFLDDLILPLKDPLMLGEDNATIIRDAVQRLASGCFVTRSLLRRLEDRFGHQHRPNKRDGLDDMLRAIANGRAPCLDPTGFLVIPGWAERRRVRRTEANEQIELYWHSGRCRTTVVDRTDQGLGVVSVAGLKPGFNVAIKTAIGSISHARVAWVAGGRAGLQFI